MSAEDTSTGPEGEAVAKNDGEEEAAVPTQDAIKHIVKDGNEMKSSY